jgi:hypothetical protein
MSMAEQFGARLPRPVSVWVLDTVPGALQGPVESPQPVSNLNAAPGDSTESQGDHPRRLINHLQQLEMPVSSRSALVTRLLAAGFSDPIARWVATNLRPAQSDTSALPGSTPSVVSVTASSPRAASVSTRSVHNGVSPGGVTSRAAGGQAAVSPGGAGNSGRPPAQLVWSFDLDAIAAMYDSYEQKSHWGLLESPPQGLSVDFVRAEHSNFRWAGGDAERIAQLGHGVHFLCDAGHWLHTDNPKGLLKIMEPAFCRREHARAVLAQRSQVSAVQVR